MSGNRPATKHPPKSKRLTVISSDSFKSLKQIWQTYTSDVLEEKFGLQAFFITMSHVSQRLSPSNDTY